MEQSSASWTRCDFSRKHTHKIKQNKKKKNSEQEKKGFYYLTNKIRRATSPPDPSLYSSSSCLPSYPPQSKHPTFPPTICVSGPPESRPPCGATSLRFTLHPGDLRLDPAERNRAGEPWEPSETREPGPRHRSWQQGPDLVEKQLVSNAPGLMLNDISERARSVFSPA